MTLLISLYLPYNSVTLLSCVSSYHFVCRIILSYYYVHIDHNIRQDMIDDHSNYWYQRLLVISNII